MLMPLTFVVPIIHKHAPCAISRVTIFAVPYDVNYCSAIGYVCTILSYVKPYCFINKRLAYGVILNSVPQRFHPPYWKTLFH
jgi:hypothetical protein